MTYETFLTELRILERVDPVGDLAKRLLDEGVGGDTLSQWLAMAKEVSVSLRITLHNSYRDLTNTPG